MAIVAGELRHLITIQQIADETVDDFGSEPETWEDLMSIRAKVEYVSGTKGIDNNEIFASQSIRLTTHYRSAITTAMRVVFDNKNYRILAIAPIGYKEGLIINAELINE